MKAIKRSFVGIAIAFLFLFNPNITVLDILPDFIGYFILMLSLTRLSDLNETLQEARQLFGRMVLVDAGKLLAILWIFGVEASNERSSSMMLWTFVFGVLELIVLLPAYHKLFEGLIGLGNFHENRSIFYVKNEGKGKSITEKIRKFTLIFVVLKSTMTFLPELADLGNTAYSDSDFGGNLYRYINVMRGLSCFIVLIVGLVWLIRILLYWNRLRRDALLIASLERTYSEKILPKEGIFVRRALHTAFMALCTAAFLTLDFRMEHFNLLPDVLAAVAFVLFFLFVCKRVEIRRLLSAIIVGLYGVSCVASMACQILFFDRFSYHSIIRNDEALALFSGMIAAEIVKALLLIATVLCSLDALRRTIHTHTGYVIGQDIGSNAAKRQILAVQKEQKRTLIYVLIATVLYAASDVCYELLIGQFGFMGLINMICGFLFVASVIKAQSEIFSAVNTKYMLE